MIELNKGHCRFDGTIPELCGDIAVAIDSVADVVVEKEDLPIISKEKAVEFVISIAYAAIKQEIAEKENRP